MESGDEYTSGGDCGVQCEGQGHSDRTQGRAKIRWRVRYHVLQSRAQLLTVARDAPLRLLTKGDNNMADDTELYARGQDYLTRSEDIIGSVVGYVPFVGYVTIMLSEHPWLKTVLLGIMGITVVMQRE